ncbi:hypothetical protein AYO21_09786 [Fonsecaea monophora]|uniref:CYTH domain-containing protein n=1 Tax=Fonsecaea monophora TaxID=254056 RepID=A0A177EVD3_9EURO|nr:hypothetical protein AYO21_09786 [Fonsecaea monophora]KAH0829260.1 group-specific protein [Fonsecaea pedrosoi]OAG35993.1 hypothetical protein AYO21_09786 [Fonsecaea monophora]
MAPKLVPDYEVKILIKPSEVLTSNNKLDSAIVTEFHVESSAKKMNIQFLDTKERDLYTSGWNLRIRKEEGEEDFELTYKKRYAIDEGDARIAGGSIDMALETALQEGFDTTTVYKAQVEVGYQKQTLSVSSDVKVSAKDFDGMELPRVDDSRIFLSTNAPSKFRNWVRDSWGTDHVQKSIIYGPVHAKRFKGRWDGSKLFIEVWPIRKSETDATLEPIVEVSFKTPDVQKALEGRAKILELFQKKGWLLPEDSSKTKLIMERYGCSSI